MSSPRVGNPRVGVSASCPVTAADCVVNQTMAPARPSSRRHISMSANRVDGKRARHGLLAAVALAASWRHLATGAGPASRPSGSAFDPPSRLQRLAVDWTSIVGSPLSTRVVTACRSRAHRLRLHHSSQPSWILSVLTGRDAKTMPLTTATSLWQQKQQQ